MNQGRNGVAMVLLKESLMRDILNKYHIYVAELGVLSVAYTAATRVA